ncbi:S49 family peptidase [Rickettsiales bacterium]|nr:S49 family peptidase [Rickettsiales bacterium]
MSEYKKKKSDNKISSAKMAARKVKSIYKKICGKGKCKVAVLRLSGVIGGGSSFKSGLSLEEINENIEKAFDIKNIKAVALQVNSPGGSPVQSELIFNRIRQLSEEKKIPVYTFVEDLAASGGYWLACAGDEIYASRSSIVGSIGVISAGFGFVELINKIGVERRVYSQGENKSVLDPFQKEKQSDIKILTEAQKDVHESFKDLVRSRREGKIKKTHEKQLFSGEFWSGNKAKDLGLIDDISDMYSVIKNKFGKDIQFEKVESQKGWLKKRIGVFSESMVEQIVAKINHTQYWSKFGL